MDKEKVVSILRELQGNYTSIDEAWGALEVAISRISNDHLPIDIQSVASFKAFNYVDGIEDGGTPKHPWNDHDVESGYEKGFLDGVKYRSMVGITVPGKLLDGFLYTHFSDRFFDFGEKTRIQGAPTEGDAIDVEVQIIDK